ncbi:chemotaxis protein CheW [Marilutibacter chinensis]|uniref:Chemotaxis protein CheW n=1 Tax=Marilutibacter chinensis TaxID=2912247 RepID=A0ABS9HUG4_9GAMM|nr:chemotaxis protein CheW [Lysobacter chinensis]MCF7221958.1 chemotaxis protein CheW [Lysobacter chinensis]
MSDSRSNPSTAPANDIRGVLIQVARARVLLPNATIAEVLSYAPPEPLAEGGPGWLLGRIRWHGWRVPLVAFSALAGIADEQPGLGSKVVVLKALGGNPRAPYFAIVAQGFPRLVTVNRAGLGVDTDQGDLPDGVLARVLHNDEPALLPDLAFVEARIAEAVAGQAA